MYEVIDNFFEPDELQRVIEYFEDVCLDNPQLFTGKDVWTPRLSENSQNDTFVYHLERKIDTDIFDWLEGYMINRFDKVPSNMRFYQYMPGSHIDWHRDGEKNGAASIYLNEDWKKEYGGLFLWREEDGSFRGELPKMNRCLYDLAGAVHSTTPTYKTSPVRRSLQVFFK